uniref:Uncharacterized protein n=1 Tax=Oryza sativa subsp. japonica TaxID=39947 RepID=Q6K5L3_ORYSJ|nr:hypothetical protein [Oryza sativa Japonica Group]BAD22112.1 hypothetical protein [Oryza sativa Japonica Group]
MAAACRCRPRLPPNPPTSSTPHAHTRPWDSAAPCPPHSPTSPAKSGRHFPTSPPPPSIGHCRPNPTHPGSISPSRAYINPPRAPLVRFPPSPELPIASLALPASPPRAAARRRPSSRPPPPLKPRPHAAVGPTGFAALCRTSASTSFSSSTAGTTFPPRGQATTATHRLQPPATAALGAAVPRHHRHRHRCADLYPGPYSFSPIRLRNAAATFTISLRHHCRLQPRRIASLVHLALRRRLTQHRSHRAQLGIHSVSLLHPRSNAPTVNPRRHCHLPPPAAACRRSEPSPAVAPSSISFAATRGGPTFASRHREPTGAPSSSRAGCPAPQPSITHRRSSPKAARAVFPRRRPRRLLPLAAMALGELSLHLPSFFPSSPAPLPASRRRRRRSSGVCRRRLVGLADEPASPFADVGRARGPLPWSGSTFANV